MNSKGEIMKLEKDIRDKILSYQKGEPFFKSEIIGENIEKSSEIKKILIKMIYEGLITQYDRNTYYRTNKKLFRDLGINKDLLINKKYLTLNNNAIGYITGPKIWHEFGLIKKYQDWIWVATNLEETPKNDEKLNVRFIKAKSIINNGNVKALQFLDILDHIDEIIVKDISDIINKLIVIYKNKTSENDREMIIKESANYCDYVRVLLEVIQTGNKVYPDKIN